MHSPLLSQCSSRLFILVPLQIQDTGSLEVLGFTCPRISNLFTSTAGFTRTGIKDLPDFVFSKVILCLAFYLHNKGNPQLKPYLSGVAMIHPP